MDKIKFAYLCSHISYLIMQGSCLADYQIKEIDTLINDGILQRDYINVQMEEFVTAMRDGRKIDAVKAHRAISGFGLKESKDFVEKYWFAPPLPVPA